MSNCTIEGCANAIQVVGLGLCSKHYSRLQRHGVTDDPHRPSLESRFWSKVRKTRTCWMWTDRIKPDGYGQFWVNTEHRNLPAHAVAYRLVVDPDYRGDLDHLCHTFDRHCLGGVTCPHRACVNPTHLQPVTRGQNSARGQYRKMACPQGHPYDEENTYITTEGHRSCRTCQREAARRTAAKRKAARAALRQLPSQRHATPPLTR